MGTAVRGGDTGCRAPASAPFPGVSATRFFLVIGQKNFQRVTLRLSESGKTQRTPGYGRVLKSQEVLGKPTRAVLSWLRLVQSGFQGGWLRSPF